MNKALPCRQCKSDKALRFRQDSDLGVYWINCERCGQVGPISSLRSVAGDKWNEQQCEKPTEQTGVSE